MFEELFKYVDWRHNSLLSETFLQKGFRVYDFLVILCKMFSFFLFSFFSVSV